MEHKLHIGDTVKILKCGHGNSHTKIGKYYGRGSNYYSVNLGANGGYTCCNDATKLELIKCTKKGINTEKVKFYINKTINERSKKYKGGEYNMEQIRRYHLRSFKSYDNDKDLVQSYRKFLYRNDLIEAYTDKFEDEEVTQEIRKVLQFNLDHDSLIIKDRHVEKWARENDVEMVNEL